jgi:hypothetical protein
MAKTIELFQKFLPDLSCEILWGEIRYEYTGLREFLNISLIFLGACHDLFSLLGLSQKVGREG